MPLPFPVSPTTSKDSPAPERRPAQSPYLPPLLAGIILVLSLLVTYEMWNGAQLAAKKNLQAEFDFRVREIIERIGQRMATYEEVLRGAKGLLLGSDDVDRAEFRTYVATLHLEDHYPGIQGVGLSEIVPKAEKNAHIARIRAQGFPEYAILPPGDRDPYTAITLIEPFNAMNQRAFGFDMYSEPVRRAAMQQARDTGQAALSGKVTLVQEGPASSQPGFLMYLPLYREGVPVDTAEQRRNAITGWVYAPFRMNDFMEGLGGERSTDLGLRINDGEDMSARAQLYDSFPDAQGGETGAPLFTAIRKISIAGHPWTLEIASGPNFEARMNRETPRFIAIAGAGISLLLSMLVWTLASGRSRALELAMNMTRELRASEFRWKYALEGAGDGVWDWDRGTGEVSFSRRWKEMLGYDEDDIGNTLGEWEKLIHPQDRQKAIAALEDYLDGGVASYVNELRMRCKDGSWKWVLTRGMAVSQDTDGKPLRIIGTHTDITRRKHDEEALRATHERIAAEQQRMKVILENSHDAFVAIDAEGRVTDWNTRAEQTFGWSAEEAIGQELAKLIVPEDRRDAHLAGMQRFAESGTGPMVNRLVEVMALHRSGTLIPVELAIAPIKSDSGYVANAFIRDISERKEAEQREARRQRALEEARAALQHSQKLEAIGKLTGGVAHDFNNLLQVITGNIQLLLVDGDNGQLREERLHNALTAVERGAKLSSQLLSFARRQPLQPKVVNIRRLVRDMDDLLRRTLGETVEVETVVAGGLWNTLVDPHQLESVILNLAINARDAMKGSGKLTIELGNAMLDEGYVQAQSELRPGQYVMLAVSDTGSGMTAEVMERAFDPFFTTKPEGEGTGLGLSMAYGFIKQSGGHIRIYSEPGHGTTVRIYLPRSFEPEDEVAPKPSEPVVGGTETVLVVEDDPGVRKTVVALLAGLGYRVLTAHDGESALAVIRSGTAIDVLFTDVVMPGSLRSPDLARQARSILPGLAVLFTSGYTQNAIVHDGRLDQGVQLLSKPYLREQLARKLREIIDAQQQVNASTKPAVEPAAPEAPQASKSRSLRILVVEDNDDLRLIACELLSTLGYRAQGARSGEDALDMLAKDSFDALLVDVGLPGMSGIQLAESVRKTRPGVRIVFATGRGDALHELKDSGSRVLTKPYNLSRLQQALEEG
ncbi:CHASE domain-containing protein [Noviherbaspirillum massiliense]|uniref:CHASE domain-containing protein n=1 Tax=Noviherbaspirillum massiliense TaxID=1465823 RepID=UPI000369F959|nr:CHASE domain-containing protein [Noviherbaspirillum massiliense]